MTLTAQQRATRCAETMWKNDRASSGMGMELGSVSPGKAVLTMTIKPRHTNGHNICHGGYIFALADSAFAFACNSYNQNTLAQHCNISFLNPAKLGDTLTAQANEISRQGRSGIYGIKVTNQEGLAIAQFRGMSRTIKGTLFEEDI